MFPLFFLLAADAPPVSSGNPIFDLFLQYGLAGLVIAVGGWGMFKIVTRVFNQYDSRIEGYAEVLKAKDASLDLVNEKRVTAAMAAVEALNDASGKLEDIHELLKDVPDALTKVKGLTERVEEMQELILGLYDALDKAPPARWRRDGR